jgi:hypothetical protein
MPDFTVIRVGTDTSGRALFSTRYMWQVWQAVLRDPDVAPFAHLIVIVQGAFMARAGGGAVASAGYHDLGGCFDIRTWNLTKAQVDILIKALRKAGIAAWRRDLSALHGGMDPHIHITAGWDKPLTQGAINSWNGYLRNQNGLASGRVDYEWRPSPLVTKPPASLFEEDYMATDAAKKDLAAIKANQAKIIDLLEGQASADVKRWTAERERDRQERQRQSQRYSDLVSRLGGLADELSGDAREAVLAVLRAEQDVTGADNPAPTES